MDKWIDFGLSLFCVTIPETIFFTLMTYIILKRFDMIDVHRIKNTLKNIFIPSITASLVLDFLVWIVLMPKGISKLLAFLVLYMFILYCLYKNTYENFKQYIWKILFSMIVGYIIMGAIELLYAPILMYFVKISWSTLYTNMSLYIITSLPARILQISLIVFIFLKHNNFRHINTLYIIFKNKSLLSLSFSAIGIILFCMLFVLKLILYNDILSQIGTVEQILLVSGVFFTLPCIMFMWIYFMITYLVKQENRLQQIYNESDISK